MEKLAEAAKQAVEAVAAFADAIDRLLPRCGEDGCECATRFWLRSGDKIVARFCAEHWRAYLFRALPEPCALLACAVAGV